MERKNERIANPGHSDGEAGPPKFCILFFILIEKSDKIKKGVIMSKKAFHLFFVALFVIFANDLFCQAQKNSASVANRRTAIRYLQLSKQNLSDKNWSEADSNANLGLAYDDSIADLWYISAAAKMNNGGKKSEVLPLVKKSLDGAEWVDYNKDGARILYADILCSMRNYDEAISVLDENPFIYSSDAEYIRAKCYYNQRTTESIENARLKIDAARRVFPKDSRFAELFYKFEFLLLNGNDGKIDELAQKIAGSFLASISNYRKSVPELELFAAAFVNGAEEKSRLIKAFDAREDKSPLYPSLALNAGIIEERAALDYFYDFADNSVSLFDLNLFIKSLKTDDAKKEFTEYLNSYNGTLLIDTDSDLITNMTVKYERGRPSNISYDENQDDENNWTSECDFGVPKNIHLAGEDKSSVDIIYGNWPYISQAVYNFTEKADDSKNAVAFDLIADSLAWSPFSVESETEAKESLGADFFVPVLLTDSTLSDFAASELELVNAAYGYTMPSNERKGAVISVSLLNGLAQQATYSVDGKIYATAKFENGLPSTRLVDMDNDGIFETVEEYGYSNDKDAKFISESDEMQVITNIFGQPAKQTGIYVKSIKIDRNGDTVPDFIEEYTAGEGKISSWDTNGDGKWDVRYVKLPSQNGKVYEQSMFYEPLNGNVVTVEFENGIPVDVKSGENSLYVRNGENENFYWLYSSAADQNQKSFENLEKKVIEKINQAGSQGVCIILEDDSERYLAVRIEDKIFAEKLPSTLVENDNSTENDKSEITDEKK